MFWAPKACAMIGRSPEESDLFEYKSGWSYCEKGGIAAVGDLLRFFSKLIRKKRFILILDENP